MFSVIFDTSGFWLKEYDIVRILSFLWRNTSVLEQKYVDIYMDKK